MGVISGVHPNNTYPKVDGKLDPEQEKRKQARQASEFAAGKRKSLPAFATKGPDAHAAEAKAKAEADAKAKEEADAKASAVAAAKAKAPAEKA